MDLRNNVPRTVFPYHDPNVPGTWLLWYFGLQGSWATSGFTTSPPPPTTIGPWGLHLSRSTWSIAHGHNYTGCLDAFAHC